MKNKFILSLLCLASIHLHIQQNIYEIYAVEYDKGDWRPAVSEIAIGATAKDTLQQDSF